MYGSTLTNRVRIRNWPSPGAGSKAVNTAKAWLSVLEATHQVVVLRTYFTNVGKRRIKTPKEPQFYSWRASAATEVDFAVDTGEKLIPIEV